MKYEKPLRAVLHILCLLPFAWLGWQFWLMLGYQPHGLTANPFQYINQYTGDWTIRILLVSLAVTPLRKLTKWNWLVKWRRPLGLYAFFYGLLHLSNYVVLDHFLDWVVIWQDLVKRPAMTFGMLALLLMIPLAVTSTKKMIRRLGRTWPRLHKLVYPIAILAVVHNIMMVKADLREPLIHLAVLLLLLGYRIYVKYRPRLVKRLSFS